MTHRGMISALVLSLGAATPALAGDATGCVVWDQVTAAQGSFHNAAQRMTNTCNQEIYVLYCHGPSSRRGARETECGNGDRYYQQFTHLKPGESRDSPFAMPLDARMYWVACTGRRGAHTTHHILTTIQ